MPEQVIYLHGFASGPGSQKARYIAEQAALLGLPVEVPDLTGGDFESLTITGQLAVVERVAMDRPVSLIGSSLGGYLAALYAARHTAVRRVVMLAPAFGFARRFAQNLGQEKLEEWRRNGWLSVYHYGKQARVPLGFRLIEDGLRYEDFPDVRQPVLLIHGLGDTVVTPDWSRQYASARPNVELELVESDHELLDVKVRVWLRIREFLGLG